MANILNGKKIRDQILAKIQKNIKDNNKHYHLAVLLIGKNAVCEKYVDLKKRVAEQVGIMVSIYKFEADDKESEIIDCIKYLNDDSDVDGIMIQIPVSKNFDQKKLILSIDPKKDVDGLRYCLGEKSSFVPPVILAINKAISESGIDVAKPENKIVIIGEGFLVGGPLKRFFNEKNIKMISINKIDQKAIEQLRSADIVISAVGKAGLVTADMVKDDVVLVDAGTSESNGELMGDISVECCNKSSFYTPVPGGIGPLTITFLLENLISSDS